jgi:hypothetical protein
MSFAVRGASSMAAGAGAGVITAADRVDTVMKAADGGGKTMSVSDGSCRGMRAAVDGGRKRRRKPR